MSAGLEPAAVDVRRVVRLWWPLAASWLLMGAELPLFTAVVARMSDPAIHLAAYSSLVFPLALTIEAPIIMLLAASTALCSDWRSYVQVRRFMLLAGGALTALHVLVAFTPLFDLVARDWIGAPPEVIEPGRIGLRLMTPWTFSIAYRRFQQGVLIRFDRARAVGAGTVVRLLANALVLGAGYSWSEQPGIVVGTCAISAGVLGEALFVGCLVQPVLRQHLKPAPPGPPLTRAAFARFYLPLALTPLVTLLAQPIGATAMSRLPLALSSLATWPAVHGLVFLTRSLGLALNEVVVALIGEPGGVAALRRFSPTLAVATTALLALIAATPLAEAWFAGWSHLERPLVELGRAALWLALPLPALNVLQSLHQGALVQARSTRAVTEAVALSLLVTSLGLAACVAYGEWPGLACAVAMLTLGNLAQTWWLRRRARGVGAAPPFP